MDTVEAGGLSVAKALYDFMNDEALPETGLAVERFRGLSLGPQWRMSNLSKYAVPTQSWFLRGSGDCPSCMSCRPSLKTCSI